MREILFRGKTDDGEWVYGSFCMDAREQFNGLCGVDGFIRLYDKAKGKMQTYEVDRETVGQYTGLKDKNGKRIFEGDIIKTDNGKESSVSVVKFGEYYPKMFYAMLDMFNPGIPHVNAYGFYLASTKHEDMILFKSRHFEIIGNIHDNPELLEKQPPYTN